MSDSFLIRELDRVAVLLRRQRRAWWLVAGWLVWAGGVLVAAAYGAAESSWLILASAWLTWTVAILLGTRRPSRLAIARRVEGAFPDLSDRLLTAIELSAPTRQQPLRYLEREVLRETAEHSRRHDWREVVPRRRRRWTLAIQSIALCLSFAAFAMAARSGHRDSLPAPTANTDFVTASTTVRVEPGNAEVERGSDVAVTATFAGRLPAKPALVVTGRDGQTLRFELTRSLQDPTFVGRLEAIRDDVTYHIEYGNERSPSHRLTVFDFPRVERLDAALQPPDYLERPTVELEDVRTLSVVEGAAITIRCRVNKPLAAVRLIVARASGPSPDMGQVFDPSEPSRAGNPTNVESAVELAASLEDPLIWTATFTPAESRRYTVALLDREQRANPRPPELILDVLPNRRPKVKLTFPGRDLPVSPLAEVIVEGTVTDDFGVLRGGIAFAIGGAEPQEVLLATDGATVERRELRYRIALEELAAEPDQLLNYYLFAEDYGPDGRVRRTCGDMYFAEVRHFEEIFRQAASAAGAAGGQPQATAEAEELVRLQKEIVNATWTLVRRDGAEADQTARDRQTVADSQATVLTNSKKLAEKLTDPQSASFLKAAQESMRQAESLLRGDSTPVVGRVSGPSESGRAGDSINEDSALPISSALSAEQAAYQSLLKLRAREHQVSQGQGGGGGGGGRSQQEMNQLELSNKENRYETERSATSQPNSGPDGEQLQVLNRLRELARRQAAVNDKLREAEAALRAARTEAEREEIRRQLKRLRDEQRDVLRDTDELQNRMDRMQNRHELDEARQQIRETRSRVREASEALRDGQVSKALAAGTRAQREFEQTNNDVRRKTAGQFDEALRNLRSEARELAETQQELNRQIEQSAREQRRTLRDPQFRQQAGQQIQQQSERLNDVLDQIRRTVEQAEHAEPLLAKQLYEAYREAAADRPGEHLASAGQHTDKGQLSEAQAAGEAAQRGLERLSRGVERAARSVLGDEVASLKRARREVDRLTEALQNELQNREGASAEQSSPSEPGTSAGEDAGRAETASATEPVRTASAASGETRTDGPQSAESPMGGSESQGRSRQSLRGSAGGANSGGNGSEGRTPEAPIAGQGFREWSDTLREVEELLDDPELRAAAARARDQARSVRAESSRHAKKPNWDLVRDSVLKPLVELRSQIGEEIARRESPDALVPIDRDPVPPEFAEAVRQYYERLGERKEK